MNRKVRILIICGSGIATSTIVSAQVKDLLKKEKIDASIKQTMVSACMREAKNHDLIVSTTSVPDVGIPVISGIGYITGKDIELINQAILGEIKKIQKGLGE